MVFGKYVVFGNSTDRVTTMFCLFWPLKVGTLPGGGGGGTLIFSYIRRLGPFFGVQNSEFQYFLGFSGK